MGTHGERRIKAGRASRIGKASDLGHKLRTLGAAALGLVAFFAVHPSEAAPDSSAQFSTFLQSFQPEAEAAGVTPELFASVFTGMTPDPAVAALTRKQPEFSKPIGAYLASQITAARVGEARKQEGRWREVLDGVEQRYGVPTSIVVAVWGLESNFGAAGGNKDVVRSLATLASNNYRPDLMRAELLAALSLMQKNEVSRDKLRGSWAGAMGQPQFMPSSFAKYAVDGDGDGRRDIWASVPDVLASIANFLHVQGYRADMPWGVEVRVPANFDLRTSRGSFAEWASRGFVRADGKPLGGQGQAALFFPAGGAGPAFLVTDNFEVLKTYNFSDAYVLSIATLADRMNGGAGVMASWPTTVSMSRENRVALQARLAALGYAVDNREGRISLNLRDTIRKAQADVGLKPDGEPTDLLLDRLRARSQ